MPLAITPDRIDLPPGSEIRLRYQTWADYEALLQRHRDTALKIRFNAHTQEITLMSPLPAHGRRIDSLVDLIKALLRHQGRDWDCSHPIALKQPEQAGAEPDACFYIQNWRAIVGKERLDLTVDPPPDLAVEVDLTSRTDLEIYALLHVPEVWIYRPGELAIYVLVGDQYETRSDSPTFPGVAVAQWLPPG